MRWKTALCVTIMFGTVASVHITIDNDLQINDLIVREPDDEPPGASNGHTTTITTTSGITEAGVTDADISTTVSTQGYPTIAVFTTTVDPNTSVGTTENHEDKDVGSVDAEAESMTEVPDSQEATSVGPGDSGIPASRSLETAEREYLVQTTSGQVQGFEWNSISGIIAYIDVPYGKFAGYFQEPSESEPWENVHDVKEHNKRCPQLQDDTYVGDLDCLTLSIFVPTNANKAGVLFHIHESNFVSGSGDPSVYGPEYFVKKGVILILPNYRLGPLGFLCLQNSTAPGNAALKDLTLALKWTKENIAAFGGDPTNIVLSGDGTSGALAGYLALSPKSQHYISKVITESGAVLSHWALDRNPTTTMEILIEQIRYLTIYNNTFESADIESIILAAKNVTIRPCLEHSGNPFLSNTPWTLLYTSTTNITFMIGSASHAGVQEALSLTESNIEQLNKKFEVFLPNDLRFHSSEERSIVGNRIKTEYFGEHIISLQHVEEMSLYYTDSWYMGPAIRTARALVSAGATVYFYEFRFVGELNRELDSMKRPINGTVRGDIVGYLFTQDGELAAENTKERHMIDTMLDLWITFIETGHPKINNVEWNELRITEDTQEQWLSIGANVELKQGLHIDRMRLWTDIYNDHFIENNFAVQLLPNICTSAMLFLLSFGFWKIHISENIIK